MMSSFVNCLPEIVCVMKVGRFDACLAFVAGRKIASGYRLLAAGY